MACIFCQIAKGEIPSRFLYQDEEVYAIRDINPKAPKHILVIPLAHIPSTNEIGPQDAPVLGKMVLVAAELAQREGLAGRGYRLIINNGPDAGQVVQHLHLHLLGGRPLGDMG